MPPARAVRGNREASADSWRVLDVATALGLAIAAIFVMVGVRVLGALPHDFDEGWLMVDARLIHGGARPFVDFPHHEPPLHLYLLALFGDVFGHTVFGYRMLSLTSLAASGVLVFALARPFTGALPALVAEVVFLFSPVQSRALTALPETPALFFTLLGAVLLYARNERWSASASAAAFVAAALVKPTCLVVAAAAAGSLVFARAWHRLLHFAVTGTAVGAIALVWVIWLSDAIFAEVVSFQLTRLGTHRVGMWAIDSGFNDFKQMLGIETPRQWAALNFRTYFQTRFEPTPVAVFALGLLAIPVWSFGCARTHPALRLFVVLWPASLLVLNFLVMDFVSPRYFIPYFGFSAFLAAGWVWLAARHAGIRVAGTVAAVACLALAVHFTRLLGSDSDFQFWGRSRAIAEAHPRVVSFSPLFFAATGAEPACDLVNAALTYGSFGESFLSTERTKRFRVSDERLIACLRSHPETPVIVDWAFYYFTRPGSRLRAYLEGEGSAQRLFFSPDAVAQWDRPLLRMSAFR
jgi:4-amino-4-deoxy-L-arabinose transferase-like glycosyltransferase